MKTVMVLSGETELIRNLKKLRAQFSDEMRDALTEEAARLHGEAEAVTPAASGKLLSSLTTSSATQPSKGRNRFAVAYLDEKAAAVHEGIHGGRHAKHETAHFKWFEKVFNRFERGAVERITQRLRRLVSGGGR